MITAVDTSVLLDVFTADPRFGGRSAERLRSCMTEGKLIACEVVWAEISASFRDSQMADQAMHRLQIEFVPMDQESSSEAGLHSKKYRVSGGRRTRIISDFLIGAHAQRHAERLLTRDRGFYRTYFAELNLLDPSEV